MAFYYTNNGGSASIMSLYTPASLCEESQFFGAFIESWTR